jgi:hypothetical protein
VASSLVCSCGFISLAINRRCSVHVELLAPKDLYVAVSVVAGAKGGKRVDVIAHVGRRGRRKRGGQRKLLVLVVV